MPVPFEHMLSSTAVDTPVAILVGWQFENSHVCHDQPAASTSQRDADELEICDEGEDNPQDLRRSYSADTQQVHNTHIGTAKKQTKS